MASSSDIGNTSGGQVDTTHADFIQAAMTVVKTLNTDPKVAYKITVSNCSEPITSDLIIQKRMLISDGVHLCQSPNSTQYYFDKVDLPTYLLSPEILDTITSRIFVRTIQDEESIMKLKPDYEQCRFLAPNSDPFLDTRCCIPLSDELIACCLKRVKAIGYSNPLTTVKYAPVGNSRYETVEQQMQNFIVSGRCDRIVGEGATGPGVEHTVSIILGENGKKIHTARVFMGSFPDSFKVSNVQSTGKWIRVVVD